ncbi:MAG: sigma 54-interacting transcriptional regulator [Acidobacteria bacterium]|nr:sigma 54-interacting transcriptional regulator [Acidobacteriota bacterium]
MSEALQTPMEQSLAARYEALIRVSQVISTHHDCKDLFRSLAAELRQVVQFDYLAVVLYDATVHRMCLHLLDGSDPDRVLEQPEVKTEEMFAWWVYQHQQPLVIPSLEKETRFPRLTEFLIKQGIQSTCAVPLTTAHRRLGALGFGSRLPAAYSEEETRLLWLVADVVALAIDDALNFEASNMAQAESRLAQAELQKKRDELQRERDRLKLLLDLNNSIVSNLELRELLRVVSASVRKVMKCDAAGVNLPDPESNSLRIYALDFPESRGFMQEEALIPMDTGPGQVFRTGQPLLCRPGAQKMNPEHSSIVIGEGLKSGCLLPLIGRERVLGVLALGRRQEDAFTQEEVDFLMQVAGQVAIAIENAFAYGQIAELKEKLAQEKLYLEDEIRSEINFEEIIGVSPALGRVLKEVATVAPTDSTVLIYGETGTGKELVARAIHNLSSRRTNPFVKLNCAAIPTGLLESELFGHEKGAFTGAIAQRIGRFELAHRGTVFLDEVGEVPLELQPKLLRVLQEREFERLGSAQTLRTDARLIAATNRDLSAMVEEQKFRGDLFYRLNVFPVRIPPLRERRDDIPLLVRHFSDYFARRLNKTIATIPSETMKALTRYHWPGNIRELQNVIERAVILSTGSVLKVPLTDLKPRETANGAKSEATLDEAQREHILGVLKETNWVLGGDGGAAARLGMKRSTLQFRMRKLGISRPTVQ